MSREVGDHMSREVGDHMSREARGCSSREGGALCVFAEGGGRLSRNEAVC